MPDIAVRETLRVMSGRTPASARTTVLSRCFALALLSCAAACRDANDQQSSNADFLPLVPNTHGSSGCSGPDQAFDAQTAPVEVALSKLMIGARSQITAATGDVLYATGAGASVVAIDFSSGSAVESVLVPSGSGRGTVAELLEAQGVTGTPDLSGIAVLDLQRLLVVEHSANVILSVERTSPFTVELFAGQPDAVPGYAEGFATGASNLARFSFSQACQLAPTGGSPERVFVADPGNHMLRVVDADGLVRRIAGNGSPAFADGDLGETRFDTPTGLSIACNGTLIASELGAFGFGNRLRQLAIGTLSPFTGYFGTCATIAGDGTAASTAGDGDHAQLALPVSPLVTNEGEIYWIDSASGILRRMNSDGDVDCPMSSDCTRAGATPDFIPGDTFSLTQTVSGILFVLDATEGVLYRVTP